MTPTQLAAVDTAIPPIPSSTSPTSSDPASTNAFKNKRKRKSPNATDVPRKKKANRACFHCQKAHLTCDDSRPCQRCVKRGIQDKCMDGIRKKAKYLLDDDELDELKKSEDSKKKAQLPRQSNDLPASLSDAPPHQAALVTPAQSSSTNYALPPGASSSSRPSLVFPYSQDISFLTASPSLTTSPSEIQQASFGSEALNNEYSIISQILGNSSHDASCPPSWLDTSTSSLTGSQFLSFGDYPPQRISQQPLATSSYATESSSQVEQHPLAPRYPLNLRPRSPHDFPLSSPMIWQPTSSSSTEEIVPVSQNPPDILQLHPLAPRWPLNTRPRTPPHYNPAWPAALPTSSDPTFDGSTSMMGQPPPPSPVPSFQSTSTISHPPSSTIPHLCSESSSSSTFQGPVSGRTTGATNAPAGANSSELRLIMQKVTAPYDYTEGYHFLMRFLKEKFEKNDILRIVRALAIFRPSLIALQMPLSLDDEIFMEQCFQRSLLELEKLMSFTGTPTVVWRRTGEISLVANEFLFLTDWTREQLLPSPSNPGGPPRRKYIYELFDPVSTVEYWENFAQHAFENSTNSVYSHCALLKPDGTPVLCSFCFTVRRDMFDLPSTIVGQWLPLL